LILITHDMGGVAEMADRVIIMRDGRMVEQGKAVDIFASPQTDYTRELLAAVPRMRTTAGAQQAHEPADATEPVALPDGVSAPVATVRDLQVRFDLHGGFFGRVDRRVHAVEGVSFSIARNE